MSTHPNAIIMCVITPDNLARKTMREIVGDNKDEIKIGDYKYSFFVAESDYEGGYQISAKEGSLVFHDYITYGYGEVCDWDEIERRKDDLSNFALDVCKKYQCSEFKVQITANYC